MELPACDASVHLSGLAGRLDAIRAAQGRLEAALAAGSGTAVTLAAADLAAAAAPAMLTADVLAVLLGLIPAQSAVPGRADLRLLTN